jgi:pepF/M3 family oligoendopeptidase
MLESASFFALLVPWKDRHVTTTATATTTPAALPHWDMTAVYPGLTSTEFGAGVRELVQRIDMLTNRFDQIGVDRHDRIEVDDALVADFEEILRGFNDLISAGYTMSAYIGSFIETNSRDDVAQEKYSEFEQQSVRIAQLGTRFLAWVGSLDLDALLERSQPARDHEYPLRNAKTQADHLMTPLEEALAAELALSGSSAWSKLHHNVWSQILVPVELEGEVQNLPMSAVRNLAYDDRRDVRQRAFESEVQAWKDHAVPFAAAINSIKGEATTLLRHRRWDTALELSLFNNHIDRATLDAMLDAARSTLPEIRRYFRAKARHFGADSLAWFDLFAPVSKGQRAWSWDDAVAFIVDQFGTYSSRLSDFADRSFRESWIDAEPRPGKSGGGFCMWLQEDQSRILVNYVPSYGGMSTLAHELGHAYHNFNLARRTLLQRETPMLLAETASIFCETIVRNAALAEAGADDQLAILEGSLQDASQVIVDIISRFNFESRLFETRRAHELSVDELCEFMTDAQRETYADALDPDTLHPYMWAVKPHYYRAEEGFYNYPYMFGLLFGLGLYARYQADPDAFRQGYDDLLSSTGITDPASLAAQFGIDIRSEAFWKSSLEIVVADVNRFETLIASRRESPS